MPGSMRLVYGVCTMSVVWYACYSADGMGWLREGDIIYDGHVVEILCVVCG